MKTLPLVVNFDHMGRGWLLGWEEGYPEFLGNGKNLVRVNNYVLINMG
jgi:hypothetical protein